MRKTNPIWAGWPGSGEGDRRSPPGRDGAKQSQFSSERNEGQVVCGKGVMVNSTSDSPRKNKAKLGQDGGLRGRCSWKGSIVQNKPNLPISDCGFRIADWAHTCGGMPDRVTSPRCPASGNKANLDRDQGSGIMGQRPETRPPVPRPGLSRQTNPICGRAEGRITAGEERSYDELGRQKAPEKQSQFPQAEPAPAQARDARGTHGRSRPCYSWAGRPCHELRQTNPISGQAEGRTSAVWITSCGEWDMREAVKKQSQFGSSR
jgi:hypothetical protein